MKKYISRQLRKIIECYDAMQQGSASQVKFINARQLVQVNYYAPEQAQAHTSGASALNAAGTSA
eukprot:6208376-Pleurochrysis_carterae.AAC.2